MSFHLAVDLVGMRAATSLAVDGPLKTSLNKGLANAHHGADIDIKGITDLLIRPAMPSRGSIGLQQDARVAVGGVREAAGRDQLLQLLALLRG